jgi:hypothetical protein
MKKSNRRKFIATATGLAGALGVSASIGSTEQKTKVLVHHAIFWLKNPASTDDRDKLLEGVRTLAKIETVKEIHVGMLASTEKRPVVDTSWQVSELMFFNDLAGQATYQNHPVHLDFIKNYGHLWEKVVVYDAMDA